MNESFDDNNLNLSKVAERCQPTCQNLQNSAHEVAQPEVAQRWQCRVQPWQPSGRG